MNELKKFIHDNANGLDYTLVNDHYLPNLTAAATADVVCQLVSTVPLV